MTTTQPNKPAWIVLDDGELFEGHQGHFANTFFSNAYRAMILHVLEKDQLIPGEKIKFEVRDMTPEELEEYPEAVEFCKQLVEEYGEC